MRNFIDEFYEHVHKNSLKRRRMVSLLLVMSMFVSTGVLWELRDTGITMVNDVEEYDASDHIHTMECYGDNHTEECYSDVLICEDESEEHTHTDECYERKLVCEDENHLYLLCDETDDDAEESEDDLEEVVIYCPSSDEESEDEENDDAEDDEENPEDDEDLVEVDAEFPELTLEDEPMALVRDPDGPYRNVETATPGTVDTIDNIANGIKFTLFDYGNADLESSNNNYDVKWNSTDQAWLHSNVKSVGINAGRTPDKDIMFFAYGTPSFTGTPQLGDDGDDYKVFDRTPLDQLDRNSYSGDYNQLKFNDGTGIVPIDFNYYKSDEYKNKYPGSSDSYDKFLKDITYFSDISGNRPVQGIVNNTLTDGFPTINGSGNSLDYLFSETPGDFKTVYTGVNHFLQEDSNGHWFYDSNDNYAYFNQDSKEFTIYDTTYHIINKDHHYANEYNALTEETYPSTVGYEMQIGFFPFDQYDSTRRDPNFNGNGFNHHFGMTMEANFRMTKSGKMATKSGYEPIVFSYSGDDDMWVFIDGVLVLDVGGIHEPTSGMIDFTNGLVWVQDDYLGYAEGSSELSMYSSDNFTKPKAYGDGGHKWIVTTLESKFDGVKINNKDVRWDSDPSKVHTINMFYLERGGCYSNLAMDINIPVLKPLTVKKEVDYKSHSEKEYDDKLYHFTILQKNENGDFVKPDTNEINPNEFNLYNGQSMSFNNLDQENVYKVIESDLDGNVFSKVYISDNKNGTLSEHNVIGDSIESNPNSLEDLNFYVFRNEINEETFNPTVSKQWVELDNNTNKDHSNDAVKFKIKRTDQYGNLHYVAINKNGVMKRTFTLNATDAWETLINDLPTRYGEYYYTYSVEEINPPSGYKPSYSVDTNGNMNIINTDIHKTDIWIEKKWENTDGYDVELQLKRKKVGYSESTKTNVNVTLCDENGTPLKNKEFRYEDVYVDGEIEFALNNPPAGVEILGAKTTDTNGPDVDFDNGVVSVSNLKPSNNGTRVNNIMVYLTTDEYKDDLMIFHHSFESDGIYPENEPTYTGDLSRWTNQGSNVILSSVSGSGNVYAKGNAIKVSNRTAEWNGAKLQLDPLTFKVNHTYSFSVYVKSDKATTFKMTFNDGLEKGYQGQDSYHQVNTLKVEGDNIGKWLNLSDSVTIPSEQNPYAMFLLIETQSSSTLSDFYMDEFVAVEGNKTISSESDSGLVTITQDRYKFGGDYLVSNNPFTYVFNPADTYSNSGFVSFGSSTVSDRAYGGNHAIKVSGRSGVNDGISHDFSVSDTGIKSNTVYNFKAQIAEASATDYEQEVEIWLNYDDEGYIEVTDPNKKVIIKGYEWKDIDVNFMMPELPKDKVKVYLKVLPINSNNTDWASSAYELWSFSITELYQVDKVGYDKSSVDSKGNTSYTQNYENINIVFDNDSISVPLVLNKEGYQEDTEWNYPSIILKEDENWIAHLTTNDLKEEDNFLYEYYVVETSVDGETNVFAGENIKYEVTYLNNNIASNTEKTPITITNKYIWYKLPATGGIGTKPIYLLGTVLTMAGILSGCNIYRRKRRQDEMAS